MLEHFVRRPVLLDAPVVHHHHAIGELERLLLVVRHEHTRKMDLRVEPTEPAAQILPDLCIERPEGFIEQQHLRLDRQRPGECHALPLAAGQLRRIAIAQVIELHERQQFLDAGANLGVGRPLRARAYAQTEGDVFLDGHVAEERVMLEDEADAAIPRVTPRGIVTVEQHRPGIRSLEPGNDAQQRRLARTGRAQQRQQLTLIDGEADAIERDERPEPLADPADFNAHVSAIVPQVSRRPWIGASDAGHPFVERRRRSRMAETRNRRGKSRHAATAGATSPLAFDPRCRSTSVLTMSVMSARNARSDATANAACVMYSP